MIGKISTLDIILQIVFIVLAILLILLIRSIFSRSVRKYIIPDLNRKGYTFIKYKWIGFIGTGDFKENNFFLGGPFSLRGSPFLNLYIYVFYKDNGVDRRLTAKIDTLFLVIRKVTYSDKSL